MYESAIPFFPQFPPKLQTISFPIPGEEASDPTEAEANAVLLKFLAQLETFLNLKSSPLNYTTLWDQVKPDPSLPPLSILLNRTYPTLISKEQTKNVRDPFYADYGAIHDGRTPFVDPVPLVSPHNNNLAQVTLAETEWKKLTRVFKYLQARWAFGDSLPASELSVAITNKTLFQTFWETHVLPAGKNDSAYCSDSIILYTAGVNIQYRNTYRK